MINNRFPTFIALLIAALALPVSADDPDISDKTISDWSFPDAVIGDNPTKENLKGKVVVVEYWGVR